MTLLTEKYPQQDFFIADIFDYSRISFKDDMASMEHPIFSLSKNKDMRLVEYTKDHISIKIIPSALGLPTIFDKDVLLYCSAIIVDKINKGETPSKTVRLSTRDLLIATNRPTDGNSYQRLKNALNRLRGVTINTNIKTNKTTITEGFGIIESYRIIESCRVKKRMIKLEITLSDWLYNALLGKEVLTIPRDYFRLGKPLERRLYEIARKHCGQQPSFEIKLANLLAKTGSTGTLDKFRFNLRRIAKDNHLPDYTIAIDSSNNVTFRNRTIEEKDRVMDGYEQLLSIRKSVAKRAREITQQANTNWDFAELVDQFANHIEKRGQPKDINGAFLGFVKRKVTKVA